jgi:ubiquinone/menaquinone biosynthesis C-methylase UbiE
MRSQASEHPRVRSVAAKAEDIPLASGTADGAFIVLALHHFNDRAKAMQDILRVIISGPLVIVASFC